MNVGMNEKEGRREGGSEGKGRREWRVDQRKKGRKEEKREIKKHKHAGDQERTVWDGWLIAVRQIRQTHTEKERVWTHKYRSFASCHFAPNSLSLSLSLALAHPHSHSGDNCQRLSTFL